MLLQNIKETGRLILRRTKLLRNARHKSAYEGDGKTTIRVLNQELDLGLLIDSYSSYGFRLNNGITVLGPLAIFPRTILSWQVRDSEDIKEPSLRLFKLLVPKIDLLVIGLETKNRKVIDTVFKSSREAQLNVEILPTEHACSTFNFLNAEGRNVAGAMIPPTTVTINEDDLMRAAVHYDNIYNKSLT